MTRRAKPGCPICSDPVIDDGARPFCSPRCRQEDLQRWLGGGYRIPGPPVDRETMHAHGIGTLPTASSEESSWN